MVCIRCQKRPAIIFIQRMDNGQMKQEGYCLHCARELHIKPVDDLMKQFGMSDQDLDNMENRMESMMEEMGDANPLSMMMNMANGGEDADPDSMDEDLIPGSNATFPLGFTSSEKKDGDKKADRKNGKKPPKRKFLDTYCENLTRKAREGKLDDIIGRDREIYRTIQILSRRQKNNPCLIGEAGVGKTAIAEGIAERIAKGDVPIGLKDKEIYLLDLTSLVAGTQFRGQFEQRVKGLLSEVKAAGNVILFIDEIHTITSAGESEGAMNAGNILKPALSRGEIQVIGATTFNEYRKYIEKDQALERRFQPVRVEEPSVADTLAVMNGIKHYYEQHHHVQVPADVLSATVTLSERYITDRFLPDKAIDLLDEACACCNLAHPVICMTSNAGSSDQSTGGLGFNKSEEQLSEEKTRKALAQFLRPEFLGRVDEVIAFKPLTEETLQGIAALMLDEYKPGMEAKGIAYSYTPAALKALVQKSQGGKFGARDLRRVIRKAVEDPAAERLIDGTLASGGTLVVDAGENGEIILK
ncbi:ATP-dependent Clp protease ATP-binding subunit [Faecalibacterium sp. Marseille-Q4896]|uniref:ATP-dependent Clp protease ATP-binding subunit n=1 Tax=Faecalibacterium sp. Marseille-Q4896 TaxID=2817018 RepID=UPI001A9B6FB3|nr:ATP-dependent Clp protease ATP-binding subunit [Faecalibacterium sp. Marseille-Q4896]MBO1357273.1 AAA family ATPase [Faecalibacterium sp. Marseille-Q4896]